MAAKLLIVDGHSMIFAWPELERYHRKNTAQARRALVKHLRNLNDSSDWNVVIVFDGKGPKASACDEESGIQVFYSASGQTADSVIERLTAKYASIHDVTVATNDHLEQTTVSSLGAMTMTSDQLLAEMQDSAESLQRRIRQLDNKGR